MISTIPARAPGFCCDLHHNIAGGCGVGKAGRGLPSRTDPSRLPAKATSKAIQNIKGKIKRTPSSPSHPIPWPKRNRQRSPLSAKTLSNRAQNETLEAQRFRTNVSIRLMGRMDPIPSHPATDHGREMNSSMQSVHSPQSLPNPFWILQSQRALIPWISSSTLLPVEMRLLRTKSVSRQWEPSQHGRIMANTRQAEHGPPSGRDGLGRSAFLPEPAGARPGSAQPGPGHGDGPIGR